MPESDITTYRAQILDPGDPGDGEVLRRLQADPAVEIIDSLDAQLANLRSLRPPPGPEFLEEPCRWAYYPWRRTVVAVLGPAGFRAVRLDRNRNIITAEEQNRFGALRIGVAGLSVGHLIAHTLVVQGMCGMMRLADFDHLELSDLNRVPAGVLDLGVNKARVTARKAAEVDPYLPVQVLDAGLTVDTVNAFLDDLDIVVDESDSREMKAVLREGARIRRIPVLMATSDQGLIDVERFDRQPDRPILHGLLGDVDRGLRPGITSGENVPRIEIDRSLSTRPQLASDVTLSAAISVEAVRRIGLGEELRSGRTHIDVRRELDQLAEPELAHPRPAPVNEHQALTLPGIPGVIAAAAIRAPSGGNVQPWHIDGSASEITIELADQRAATMDVGFRGSAVALGAALLNAQIAAAAHNVLGPSTLSEHTEGSLLRATVAVGSGTDPVLAELYRPMLARETNRHTGHQQLIDNVTIEALTNAARRQGARLHVITDEDQIASAAAILASADRTRYLTPHLHSDMISELRWAGDPYPDTGIDVGSLELSASDLALLEILRRPDVMAHLAEWNVGSALGDDTRNRILASSALAVITVPGQTLRAYAVGGSAVELVWIIAQQRGLSVQPMSPVFLYAHNRADLEELSAAFADELNELQHAFRRLAQTPSEESIVLILRLTTASPPTVPSRRSLDRVRLQH